MKRIAILGSTGSIGRNTLEVARHFPKEFCVLGLSTNSNIDVLYQQINEFHPAFVCVKDEKAALNLKSKLNLNRTKLFVGNEGFAHMAAHKQIDEVVIATPGLSALLPLLAAIDNKKPVALANKEALVAAGPIIMRRAKKQKLKIMPIDSEQSAIWQCLNGQDRRKLKNIYLTASGGPFSQKNKKYFKDVSIRQVLQHPRWKMGKKVTVDSATLMNKGLEVLEAMYLFDVPADEIKIIIHPEAIVHSMVEFIDGVILAQLSITDMRIPIQYALSYPQRLPNTSSGLDFCRLGKLNFQRPDFRKFPCLGLAYRAAKQGGTLPAALNAADEVCVDAFLKKKLGFIAIPKVIERVLDGHKNKLEPDLDDILEADNWGRREAGRIIDNI